MWLGGVTVEAVAGEVFAREMVSVLDGEAGMERGEDRGGRGSGEGTVEGGFGGEDDGPGVVESYTILSGSSSKISNGFHQMARNDSGTRPSRLVTISLHALGKRDHCVRASRRTLRWAAWERSEPHSSKASIGKTGMVWDGE